MQNIHTLAIRITHETYSIAVACLAGGFATLPLSKVLGNVLVINELVARPVPKSRGPIVTLENSWMSEKDFLEFYELTEDLDELDTAFVSVNRK